MNRRSAFVIAAVLATALMAGVAGATSQALTLKASGAPRTVVVVQQSPHLPPAPPAPTEQGD